MKALVVGAGAVGQVFGRHLQLGGADVTFLVRDKYAAACRDGFLMYPLNRRARDRATPVRFDGAGVVTEPDGQWDQVWITVSSTALRAGGLVDGLASRTGAATIVTLQPGYEDGAYVRRFVDPERVVYGIIP